MSSGSSIRPGPFRPLANSPLGESKTWLPKLRQAGQVGRGGGVLVHVQVHSGGQEHGAAGREVDGIE